MTRIDDWRYPESLNQRPAFIYGNRSMAHGAWRMAKDWYNKTAQLAPIAPLCLPGPASEVNMAKYT